MEAIEAVCRELVGVEMNRAIREIELVSMLRFSMRIKIVQGNLSISCSFGSEQAALWLKGCLESTYSIRPAFSKSLSQFVPAAYSLKMQGKDAKRLLICTKLVDPRAKRIRSSMPPSLNLSFVPAAKAVWRGAFLAKGKILDCGRGLEIKISCPSSGLAKALLDSAEILKIDVEKGAGETVEAATPLHSIRLLDLMGAHEYAIKMYGCDKEVVNGHKVSCLFEANKKRSVDAGRRSFELIRDAPGILEGPGMDPTLKDIGELRLSHPKCSLRELGELSTPPLSKDAVAGRLRRLCMLIKEKAPKGR